MSEQTHRRVPVPELGPMVGDPLTHLRMASRGIADEMREVITRVREANRWDCRDHADNLPPIVLEQLIELEKRERHMAWEQWQWWNAERLRIVRLVDDHLPDLAVELEAVTRMDLYARSTAEETWAKVERELRRIAVEARQSEIRMQQPNPDEELLDDAQVAARANVSERTVQRARRAGDLRVVQVGKRGVRVPESAVVEWLSRR